MDYEKKYNEALERFKSFKEKYCTDGNLHFGDVIFDKTGEAQKDLDAIFPELVENEDEKIRKEIIDFIQWAEDRGMTRHDYHQAKRPAVWIAYLEKQKEPHYTKRNALFDKCVANCDPVIMKRVSDEVDEKLKEQNPAEYLDLDNASQDYVYNHFCQGADFTPDYIKGLMEDAFIDGANWQKEQKPLSTEETELNSIAFLEQMGYTCIPPGAKTAEWSEEDAMLMDELESYILYDKEFNDEQKSWRIKRLKSLRPSKDCSSCAKHLEGYISGRCDAENKLLEQFGAIITPEDELHIKPRWKPSEEQMGALNYAYCELFKREDVGHNILGPLQKLCDELAKL